MKHPVKEIASHVPWMCPKNQYYLAWISNHMEKHRICNSLDLFSFSKILLLLTNYLFWIMSWHCNFSPFWCFTYYQLFFELKTLKNGIWRWLQRPGMTPCTRNSMQFWSNNSTPWKIIWWSVHLTVINKRFLFWKVQVRLKSICHYSYFDPFSGCSQPKMTLLIFFQLEKSIFTLAFNSTKLEIPLINRLKNRNIANHYVSKIQTSTCHSKI